MHSIALDLELMEPLSPLEKLIHTLVMAKLEQDVDVVTIFEKMHKLSDVRMFYRSMDLDLTHKLLFCSTSLE